MWCRQGRDSLLVKCSISSLKVRRRHPRIRDAGPTWPIKLVAGSVINRGRFRVKDVICSNSCDVGLGGQLRGFLLGRMGLVFHRREAG
jgi:hypothetical protein